jgi:aspartyl-tRNA(Asn)/glutamyl-tRNA(Gln) amidotransferase subunit B
MTYEVVVGLEVHAQLATRTKLFCGCSTEFGSKVNSQTCPVCMGAPGALPVLNSYAIELAIKSAIALNCKISGLTKFDRKNYFYPDLPKNYQISQYDVPLSSGGFLDIELGKNIKRIHIRRVHLEEDAGKLIHDEESSSTLVDLNRTGIPLIEIVSEPDINSSQEAYCYLSKLRSILRYIGVSNCDMEKGELRCDINISARRRGEKRLGTKTEVKNLNSFKFAARAIDREFERQKRILESGNAISHQTLLYDSINDVTVVMRTKEDVQDYRYFPEPDLPQIIITKEVIEGAKKSMPEMPSARKTRFMGIYNITEYDAMVLTSDKCIADFFEQCAKIYNNPKSICNLLINDLMSILNEKNIDLEKTHLVPVSFAELVQMLDEGKITNQIGKLVLTELVEKGGLPAEIVKEEGLLLLDNRKELENVALDCIAENPQPVRDFYSGKKAALTYLVGQVMKKTKGKANPKLVNEILQGILSKNV